MLHGHNKTHNTDQCKTLKKYAEEKKQVYSEKKDRDGKKAYNKHQLNALVRASAASMLKDAMRKRREARIAAQAAQAEAPGSADLYNFEDSGPSAEETAYLNTLNGSKNVYDDLDRFLRLE